MTCPTCKNPMQTVTVHRPGGAMGRRIRVKETYCPYCEWKGTTGAGKALRDAIKEHNK